MRPHLIRKVVLPISKEWALRMIFKGSGCLQFPEAVVTSTVKESLYQTWFTSSRFFIGVETAEYKRNNFGSEGKSML